MQRCSVRYSITTAHRHDTQDGPLTASAGHDRTGQDIKHRNYLAREARPHGPGAMTLTTWTSAGPSQRSITPDSPSTGSDEVAQPALSPQTWTNGRCCAVNGQWAPGTAARPPLSIRPPAPRWLHASTASLGQPGTKLATELARQAGSGPLQLCQHRKRMPSYGLDGVRHWGFDLLEGLLAFCAARLRSSLATLWLRE